MQRSKRTTHKTHIDFPVGTRVRNSDLSGYGCIMTQMYISKGLWQYEVVSYSGDIKEGGALMIHPANEKNKKNSHL